MHPHENEIHIRALAASAATKEEIEKARQRTRDGSKPVNIEKRPYRPKPTSRYQEPPYLPDEDDTLEIIYRSGGTAISRTLKEVEERDPRTIIQFDEKKHAATLDKSLQWDDCPLEL
jgi:hypothetical protein